MPAGRLGPAWIATANFSVLKAYNESDLYALFVGHLADRLRAIGRCQQSHGLGPTCWSDASRVKRIASDNG